MPHLLSLQDVDSQQFDKILNRAAEMKQKRSGYEQVLAGKTVGMIFFKNSTRTRVSFSAGISYMGGAALYFGANDLQLSRGEPIKDTARVLSRYLSALVIRTFKQSDIEELAEFGSIPVINALTDLYHPCQALADFLTVQEVFGRDEKIKLTYIGDGNNVTHSLLLGAALAGHECCCLCPDGYQPNSEVLNKAEKLATKRGGKVWVTNDADAALKDARAVYTDVWASMGQEAEAKKRIAVFSDLQVNAAMMNKAASDAIFLHCLPAHRGEEVTDEVIESQQSKVWDQAENRMWVQMALLEQLIG